MLNIERISFQSDIELECSTFSVEITRSLEKVESYQDHTHCAKINTSGTT